MKQKKLDSLGQSIFDLKYAHPSESGFVDRCRSIARHISSVEKDDEQAKWYDKFYDSLVTGDLVPGGRIIFGSGRNKQNLLNCFVLCPEDHVESIGKLLQDVYKISCGGGGIGFNFSKVRPKGDDIGNLKNSAPGSVSVMKLVNSIGDHVKAGFNRRTALMSMLNVDHPDLIEFLHVKLDRKELNNFNISVVITDEFINACEKDLDWHFTFNNREYFIYKIDKKTKEGNIESLNVVALNEDDAIGRLKQQFFFHPSDEFNKPEKVRVKALDLWNRIWDNAVESGEPGIYNWSLANKYTTMSYFTTMDATNPCFSGKEKLLTSNGYRSFKELYDLGTPVDVVQDTRVSYVGPEIDGNNPSNWKVDTKNSAGFVINKASNVILTKKQANVIKVETSCGQSLTLTPDHHIATMKRGMVEAKDLLPGENILIGNTPIKSLNTTDKKSDNFKLGYLYGLFVGDGHLNKDHNSIAFQFWGVDKQEVENVKAIADDLFSRDSEDIKYWCDNNHNRKISSCSVFAPTSRGSIIINSTYLKRKFAGFGLITEQDKFVFNKLRDMGEDFLFGFLSGMIFTDGTINNCRNSQFSIRIGSINQEMLNEIQLLLLEYGIFAKVYSRRKKCRKMMPDGKGGLKEYECQEFFELIFDGEARKLINSFVELKTYKKEKFDRIDSAKSRDDYTTKWFTKVKSISDAGIEDVYCIKEDIRRTIIVNGIVSRRCGEVPLEKFSNCCLGHINLSNMLTEDNKDVDWKRLAKTVRSGIRFLDNVLTANHYPIPETKTAGERSRRIGLGTLGLHHMLIKLGIRYGSEKCLEFLDRLYGTIKEEAYLTSMYIAREKGSFPEFDVGKYLAEDFSKTLTARTRMLIRQNGIRNAVMLTAAPTGTISMVMGTSTGIEPIFAPMYMRRWKDGNSYKEAMVLDPMFKEALEKGEDASHIVGAYDITPEEHFAVQACVQRHIDNSISKTINLPASANKDSASIAKLALKYVPYLKGSTVYRAESRGEEPLKAIPLTPENIQMAKDLIAQEKASVSVEGEACRIGGECGA